MKYELKMGNKVIATMECMDETDPITALLWMAASVIAKLDHAGNSDQPSETDGASP